MQSDSPTSGSSTPPLKQRVGEVIDQIRPMIQGDGGDIELVGVSDDGVVQVRFHGACVGCPAAGMTLAHGVEARLKALIPEVSQVVLA
jgi:Fe-S cluster biogenesis protein NfuA